jgi:S1-C subfamily serine protease
MSHITVVTTEGYKLNGTVVKSNIAFDLALLKVDASGVTCLSLGNSEELALGEEVFAIGTGASEKLNQSISKGIVSGFRTFDDMPYIQTDVAINPGNSGGPLVNELGKVMGIATMKLSGDNLEGIGFCIPISKAIEMLNITFKN